MTYISEKYQLGVLAPFLDECYQDYICEGVVYSIPIDILAINEGDVISIELKSRDHKRGLAQAERNTAFTDYSYLSVWKDQVSDHLVERLSETPIGLIAVDDDVEIIQKGEKLDPNPYAKNVTMDIFNQDV